MNRLLGLLATFGVLLLAAGPAQATFRGGNGLLVLQPLRGGGLELTDVHGRRTRAICTDSTLCGQPRTPRFAADGQSIVFTDARTGRPVIVADDGTCMWCLLGPPLSALTASASAFASAGQTLMLAGAKGLWQLPLTGRQARELKLGAIQDAVSSGQGTLAFVARGSIWLQPPGRSARWLAYGSEPSFTPDGRHVAFAWHGWIWSVSLHSGRATRLVRGSSPAFSPDGHELAFIGSGGRVYIGGVRGRHARLLRGVLARYLDWQPLPRQAASAPCSVPSTQRIVAQTPEAVLSTDSSTWWGCLTAIGRRWPLAQQPGTGQVTLSLPQLSGRFAAFTLATIDPHGACSVAVVRVDLASGSQSSPYSLDCGASQGSRGVDSLVLDNSGFLGWHAFEQVAVPHPLIAAACPASSLCLAGDALGNLASETSGAWSLAKAVPALSGPIACAGASLCVAADGGSVVGSTAPAGGAWSTPAAIDPTHLIAGIACPSTNLCVAVDSAGEVITSTSPASGSWTLTPVTSGSLSGISCPVTSLCVAVGANGVVLSSTDPAGGAGAWTASAAESGAVGLAGVSCPSVHLCLATDQDGNVLTSTNPGAASPTWTLAPLPVNPGVSQIAPSCTPSVCLIAYGAGVMASPDPTSAGSWTATQLITGTGNRLAALACAPAGSLCLATDQNGNVLTSTNPGATPPTWTTTAVDVPPCGACIAEQLYADDDRGLQALDAVQPGPGQLLSDLTLAGDSTRLRWARSGQAESAQLH